MLQLGQGGGVPRPQVQLLQVHAVRVILDPGRQRNPPQIRSALSETGNRKCASHPPGCLILLGVDHGVLDGFVDQSVHVRREGDQSLRQGPTALGQERLSLPVDAELHLTEGRKQSAPKVSCPVPSWPPDRRNNPLR